MVSLRTITRLGLLWAFLAILPVVVQAQFTYVTNGDSTITITRYTGPGGAVDIPGSINDLLVTRIGTNAFYDCTSLTSVTMSPNLRSLEYGAFGQCFSLTNVAIGTNVTSIGVDAFAACTNLPNITIPDSVTSISHLAFEFCVSLTNITIGSGVTNIEASAAFFSCRRLSRITVDTNNPAYTSLDGVLFDKQQATLLVYPAGKAESGYTILDGVINIGIAAFEQCTNLTRITIPASVTNVGIYAFGGCNSLMGVHFEGNAPSPGLSVFDGATNATVYYLPRTSGWETTFSGRSAELLPYRYTTDDNTITITEYIRYGIETVTIPSTIDGLRVTSLGEQVFGLGGVTSVTVPDSVTNIGKEAFRDCWNLTTITIGTNVTNIGDAAFQSCDWLTSVYFRGYAPNLGLSVFDGAFCVTVYYFPLTGRWDSTFGDRPTELLPYMYTTDGAAITITGYTGSNGVLTIPSVMNGLPVSGIGVGVFSSQAGLTNATIPGSITNIGDEAFRDCTNLMGLFFNGNAPSLGSSVFTGSDHATIYYLPGTTGWDEMFGNRPTVLLAYTYTTNGVAITITKFTGPGGMVRMPDIIDGLPVTSIGDRAFFNCFGLTGIMIGTNVTSIGVDAFGDCTNLTSVVIPTNVTNIGYQAFEFCTSLTNVFLGAGVHSIGQWAFAFCWNLTSITVDSLNPAYSGLDGVLFNKNKTALIVCPAGIAGTYAIPENVTNIVSTAFSSCSRLTSVTIPDRVTDIGDYAFGGCNWLTNAIALNGVTRLGVGAFYNCSRLPGVTLGNGVTSIGHETFFGCRSLAGVTIPNSVTNIGEEAFLLCTALTSVTIPSGVIRIGNTAFSNCTSLNSVTIPASVTSIGSYAFEYCTNLPAAYFGGNAPSGDGTVFSSANNGTAYYFPGTTNWGSSFGGRTTVLWNPQVQNDANFGVRDDCFGFTFTNGGSPVIVVEACTNLISPDWLTVSTNTLTGGSSYFSDPQWTNSPARFYGFRMP